MKNVAIITARGGSKRIPGKNKKVFSGKPILVYSIEAAIQSGVFEEVMVTTDDKEIAEIAKAAGAAVPFMRSGATAGDFATTSEVLAETFEKYREIGKQFAHACCIYPTAPFVTAKKLKDAMALLEREKADCVMPVVRFSFPPQRSFVIRDNSLVYRWPENRSVRTQDLEPYYHDPGQFYCFRVDSFLQTGQVVEGKVLPIEVPDTEVQDIDEPSDWVLAELKYQYMLERQKKGGGTE